MGLALLSFFLLACSPASQISLRESTVYPMNDSTVAETDSFTIQLIRPYSDQLRSSMGVVLARSSGSLEKGLPESPLGNFVSDLCLLRGKLEYNPSDGKNIDFAVFNNGGLRKSLPAGEITKGDVFELMPFENELVILTMNGADVEKIFNFIASKGGAPVSGTRFTISNGRAEHILIDNKALDESREYKILTSDYLANGGDQFNLFTKAIRRESTGIKIRDAIIQHLYIMGRTEQIVHAERDGRIIKNDQ